MRNGSSAPCSPSGVDTFCDLRARRGVRGREYAFANSQRLQARLAELGIRYVHRLDLAPSAATRSQQHAADAATHTRKTITCDPQSGVHRVVSPRTSGRLRRRGIPGRPRLGCACSCPVLRGARACSLSPFTAGGTFDIRSRRESHPSDAVRHAQPPTPRHPPGRWRNDPNNRFHATRVEPLRHGEHGVYHDSQLLYSAGG